MTALPFDDLPPPLAGRDAELPEWLRTGGERPQSKPRHDSVVVSGTGIGGLVLAGRLARSPAFAGKVTLAGPPVAESRRLIGGVTLRARALDYFAVALGTTLEQLTAAMFEGREREAETRAQFFAKCSKKRGRIEVGKPIPLMGGPTGHSRPFVYGVRNSRMNRVLADLVAKLDVSLHPHKVTGAAELRALARGSEPLLVNANAGAIEGAPFHGGAPPPAPAEFVVTHQVPYVSRSEVLRNSRSLICANIHSGGIDLAVFFPFIDPLTPAANYYGNIVHIVRPGPKVDPQAELVRLKETLRELEDRLQLEPQDPEETAGGGKFPASSWRPVADSQEGVLDLHRIAGAGTPIISADGMLRAGIAGLVGAEAIIHGVEPNPLMNRALATYSKFNQISKIELTKLGPLMGLLVDLIPGIALEYPHRAGARRDMWAGKL